MKKRIFSLLVALLVISMAHASAQGVTIKTVSIFAGKDTAAATYQELLSTWAKETGNTVQDTSGNSDEAWKINVVKSFAANDEADVLFYFANTADATPILSKVVPIHEINEAYPELNLLENPIMTEDDGNIYAIPVRPFWEGLFINTDLFQAYDLELPDTWEKLETAIAVFNENDIIPISVALNHIPNYIMEHLIMACSTKAEYTARPKTIEDVPESWIEGMGLLRHLYTLNAFAKNANATDELITSQLFREKKAAMQLDGSWFANSIPEENWDTTIVINCPTYTEDADSGLTLNGASMGFYLTRRAWEDPERRDAAVSLFSYLTNDENSSKLGSFGFGGALWDSSDQLQSDASKHDLAVPPTQDKMDPAARQVWFDAATGLADGSLDPAQVWADVMERAPFGS